MKRKIFEDNDELLFELAKSGYLYMDILEDYPTAFLGLTNDDRPVYDADIIAEIIAEKHNIPYFEALCRFRETMEEAFERGRKNNSPYKFPVLVYSLIRERVISDEELQKALSQAE